MIELWFVVFVVGSRVRFLLGTSGMAPRVYTSCISCSWFSVTWFWICDVGFDDLGVFTCVHVSLHTCTSRLVYALASLYYVIIIYMHTCSCITLYPVRVDLGVDIICIASRAPFHEACWRFDAGRVALCFYCVFLQVRSLGPACAELVLGCVESSLDRVLYCICFA